MMINNHYDYRKYFICIFDLFKIKHFRKKSIYINIKFKFTVFIKDFTIFSID